MKDTVEMNFEWDIRVPIFKNKIILKQLFLAIGIPFGILFVVLLLVKAYYGVLLIVMLLFFTVLFVLIVFRGTYDTHFRISGKGILCENQPKQGNRVKKLSVITFLVGLIAKNPTAAGAGLLSGQRTTVLIPWKRIRKIKCFDKQKTIMIHGGFGENIVLFCNTENYAEIKEVTVTRSKLLNNQQWR
jgi:hypothetical protein